MRSGSHTTLALAAAALVALAPRVALPRAGRALQRAGVADAEVVGPALSELSSDVVYAASKRLQRTQEAPAIVHVFTREQIRAGGYGSLNELLATVAELELVDTGHEQYLVVRGTPFTLLALLDGVSLVNHGDNLVDLDRLVPIELVRKVELVLSPGGVLWGARALYGVVNVITRELTERRQLVVSGGGGSWHTARAALDAASRWGELRWQLHLGGETGRSPTVFVEDSLYRLGQYGNRGPTQADASAYFNAAGSLRYGGAFARALLSLREHRYPISHLSGARTPRGASNRLDRTTLLAVAGYERTLALRRGVALRLRGTLDAFDQPLQLEEFQLPPSAMQPGGVLGSLEVAHQWRVAAALEAQAGYRALTTTAGLDLWRGGVSDVEQRLAAVGQLNQATPVTACASEELSLYAQQQYSPHPTLELAAGVRGNFSSSYRAAALLHGHAVFEPLDGLFVKLNYSEGFRPPSFEQRFLEARLTNLRGSTDLDAERARVLEGQAVWDAPLGARLRLRARAGYTLSVLQDLIGVLPAAQPVFANIAHETLHSVSGTVRLRVDGVGEATASYAHHLPPPGPDGEPRRDFAADRLTVAATATAPRWRWLSLTARYSWTGSRLVRGYFDPQLGERVTLEVPGFHDLSLVAGLRLGRWTATAALHNALAQRIDHVAPYTRIDQIHRGPFPRPHSVFGFVQLSCAIDLP